MTDNTQAEVERYHPSYCDKYEVLRGIYPNDRRLTGKDCSCGFEQALLDWRDKVVVEARNELLDALENHKKTLDYIVIDGAPRNHTNYAVYMRKALEVGVKIAKLEAEL